MISPAIAYTRIKLSMGLGAKIGLAGLAAAGLGYGAKRVYDSVVPSVSRSLGDRYDEMDRLQDDEGSTAEGRFTYEVDHKGRQVAVPVPRGR